MKKSRFLHFPRKIWRRGRMVNISLELPADEAAAFEAAARTRGTHIKNLMRTFIKFGIVAHEVGKDSGATLILRRTTSDEILEL